MITFVKQATILLNIIPALKGHKTQQLKTLTDSSI